MLRGTAVRLAESISKGPLNLEQAGASLLPPLPLYRGILRAHRLLPLEMRSLGDNYVRAEFRRHREVTNKVHIIGFLSQWKVYLDGLPSAPGEAAAFKGRKLDTTAFEKMSGEQLGQLYELMHATQDIWKSAEELQQQTLQDRKESL